jgi:hypothetical protein
MIGFPTPMLGYVIISTSLATAIGSGFRIITVPAGWGNQAASSLSEHSTETNSHLAMGSDGDLSRSLASQHRQPSLEQLSNSSAGLSNKPPPDTRKPGSPVHFQVLRPGHVQPSTLAIPGPPAGGKAGAVGPRDEAPCA